MKEPSIFKRISIRWLPDPPSEPTSTLVLTLPNGYFVDIRIFKSSNLEGNSSHGTTIGQGSSLEWAFAGRATYTVDADGKRRGTWEHEIDSRRPKKGEFVDTGTLEDMANGDELERGTMYDPSAGCEREYEEIWRSHKPEPSIWQAAKLTQVSNPHDPEQNPLAGLTIRVANWVQGILRESDGDVSVVRAEFDGKEWHKTFGCGNEQSQMILFVAAIADLKRHPISALSEWQIIDSSP